MQTYSGLLKFISWGKPWTVTGPDGEYDMREGFWQVADALKDKTCAVEQVRDKFHLFFDLAGLTDLEFKTRGEGIMLVSDTGFSNVASYLELTLQALNGRQVIVNLSSFGFRIDAAPGEDVPSVKYYGDGNMSRVPKGMEVAVCKMGQGAECCIFLTGSARGFECAKFDGAGTNFFLHRHAEGKMNAGRIGNCKNIGRE